MNRYLYNPARMSEDELLARFIVREKQFQVLWEEISSSSLTTIDQHFLIIGQRGMGKTTLMLKLAYEIGRNPQLKDWLIPIVFPEELFGVAELQGLWMALGDILEEWIPGIMDSLEQIAQQQQEYLLIQHIREHLAERRLKLVLFIDNLGDILDRLEENEVRRLREILMTATDIRLVGASTRFMDHAYRYDKPFFDFFNTIFLPGLNREESISLMKGLAAHAGQKQILAEIMTQHPARVEAIRRLTGGVPRLLLLLYNSLMGSNGTEIIEDMETILDQVSPYYKHRVEELPPQQRSIFHQVAMAWDAVSTKEIAGATRLESKKVSAQLQQMVQCELLEQVETDKRNHLYRIKERFFNIWYLMRMAGSRSENRMRWLTAFLETWLEGPEPNSLLQRFIHQLSEAGSNTPTESIEELMEGLWKMQIETEHAERPEPQYSSPTSIMLDEETYRCEEPSAAYSTVSDEIQLAVLHVWNSQFLQANAIATGYFQRQAPINHHFPCQELYLTTLLIRHQTSQCLKIFEASLFQLKDVFKPLWYALMKLIGDEGRHEYLRMGPELEETVLEIVDFVLEMRAKYPS
jgi:AAA domain